MIRCAVPIATLISVAAATISIQLSHAKLASSHEEIQQLALTGLSSSLQSEASGASDMNVQNISNEIEKYALAQLRANHGSAAHTDPRVGHDATASASVHSSIMKRIESHPRVRVVSLIVFISIHRDVKTNR